MGSCKVSPPSTAIVLPKPTPTAAHHPFHISTPNCNTTRAAATTRRRTHLTLLCSTSTGPHSPPTTTGRTHVTFHTLGSGKLGISRYPDFDYDASGGSGTATCTSEPADDTSLLCVSFDVGSLRVPPLTSATTRFLGLPLPPFLRIDIVPELLDGVIDRATGKVELEFRAKFLFSMGSIYRAPALMVGTTLTTEEADGEVRGGKGERMDRHGTCRLVGVASVVPVGDALLDTFLGLPTECLAVLNARISISSLPELEL